VLPVCPIILFKEPAACEANYLCRVLPDVAGEDDIIPASFPNTWASVSLNEVKAIIELIVSELGKIVVGYNGRLLWEISGDVSGCKKSRVHVAALDKCRR
jgi:hypothetical protein